MPAVIVAMAVVFGSLNPNFWSVTNLANVSRQMSILALLSLGQTFAILSGGIDLSVGSLLALVSVVCAQQMKDFGVIEGMAAGVIAGGLAGLVNGVIIARARVPAFIATLGMLVAARGAALTLSGGLPIAGLPREFLVLGAGYLGPIPIPTVIAIVAFLLAHVVLSRTRFGRYVYAMGSNEEAAVLSGINVAKKHQRGNPNTGQQGGIVDKEAPIQASNVAIYNNETGKADRVGFRIENGKKVRFFKSTKKSIDV